MALRRSLNGLARTLRCSPQLALDRRKDSAQEHAKGAEPWTLQANKKQPRKKPGGQKQKPGVLPTMSNGAVLEKLPTDSLSYNELEAELSEEELEELDAAGARFMDAVVKVYCVHTEPNWSLPWQRKRQYASTSSGFIVDSGKKRPYLLTNAHSVEYHSQVKVKRRGDDQKFLAQVLAIGTECDIALLTVEDDAFWEGVEPLKFGPLPRLQDAVAVIGYPIGGDTISVTSGVVSRIEVTAYVHGSTELLAVQIDAAINSGNSGGPVFNANGQCVGIAFQSIGGDAENVGYAIPLPVISHFLSDFERNGRYSGFPNLNLRFQRMESNSMRAFYGMAPKQKGVLIRHVAPTAPTAGVMQADDVLMRFDGIQIANDATVPFRVGERIAFNYLVSQKFSGETAELEVLRGGQPHTLQVTLTRPSPLVPLHLDGQDPSYFVIAGLVFTHCSEPYLSSEYGSNYISDSPVKLLDRLLHGDRSHADEQVVVLSQVLACDATLGYEDLYDLQLQSFNGTAVRNLRHLAGLVRQCEEPHMRFDLDHHEAVLLDCKAGKAATEEILTAHSIPLDVSPDLKDLSAFPPGYSPHAPPRRRQLNAAPEDDAADFADL
ncbi:hypothetical protein WJX73_001994 [Symbiochloris irregularis]|uniref:Protease Do-like PDZ domain-containing protein n=1 Tax=Symbiochloris irregularis TaxID=706552 RepID=A0AAW1PYY6_9CHLO